MSDVSAIRVTSSTDLASRYYPGAMVKLNDVPLTSAVMLPNMVYAVPFFSGHTGLVDRIGFTVLSAAGTGTRAQVGMYAVNSIGTFLPIGLILSCSDTAIN